MSDAVAAGPLIRRHSLSRDQVAEYEREGSLLLRGLISPKDAVQLRQEVLAIMETIGLGMTKLRQSHEYLRGSGLDALINSPHLRDIAEQLMGGPSTLYLPFTAVKSANGGGKFDFHQDNQYTRLDAPGINLWIALNEMTPDNGCLQIAPRSHLAGTLDAEVLNDGHRKVTLEPSDFVSVVMEPGDCLAFTRLTVHGSGPNITDQPRVAYAVQFHRDDARATWAGQDEPVLLKDHPRWSTGPVDRITPLQGQLDGH